MRRLHVTAAMKSQLASLRDARGKAGRGGVMRVPRILNCDEWERHASVQQDALIAASAEDRARPAVRVGKGEGESARRQQAEHEAAFLAEKAQERSGGLDLVRANEVNLRRMITR
jgi:predicted nuclease of restriction endonuclease-like RecB superfamily